MKGCAIQRDTVADGRNKVISKTQSDTDRLQADLLTHAFAKGHSPQSATAAVVRLNPKTPILVIVFVLTKIGAELHNSFHPEPNRSPADWYEAAASLACDVYGLTSLGHANPTCDQLVYLWNTHDPYLSPAQTEAWAQKDRA